MFRNKFQIPYPTIAPPAVVPLYVTPWLDYSAGNSNYRVFEQSMLCKCFDLKQKYLIKLIIFHILSSTCYFLTALFVDITRHARGRGLLLKAEDARA